MDFIPPLVASAQGALYQQSTAGLFIPQRYIDTPPSSSRAIEVSPTSSAFISEQSHIRAQIWQTRALQFVLHQMYSRDTWVRACVDYIARRATADPDRLTDKRDPLNPDIEDLADFHEDCYADGDFEDLRYGAIHDMIVFNHAYLYIERNGKGLPMALWPLDARVTYPITDLHGTILFHVQSFNGKLEFFDKDDVIYFSTRNNNSTAEALSTLETLFMSVAMEANALKFNEKLFENGLNLGAIIAMPGADEEEVAEADRVLKDRYSGAQNAGKHLILRGDAALLRDGATAQKDLDWEHLLRDTRTRACAVLGVPESLLGVQEHAMRGGTGTDSVERSTYVHTVRPFRLIFNRRYTRQFIRNSRNWGSKYIKLQEPIDSRLPSDADIAAVAKIAAVGVKYNDMLEMLHLDRVPNGDYYLQMIPGGGGYLRLDLTAMPGLGDPDFDFVAYEAAERTRVLDNQALTAAGQAPGLPALPYVPPRSQDSVQTEPVAARIINISRALDAYYVSRALGADVSRRNPGAPGTRGGAFYITSGGGIRYGPPPKSSAASDSGSSASSADQGQLSLQDKQQRQSTGSPAPGVGGGGKATNSSAPSTATGPPVTGTGVPLSPTGVPVPQTMQQRAAAAAPPPAPLSSAQQLQMNAARVQVWELLGHMQDVNLDNEEFLALLGRYGWVIAGDTPEFVESAAAWEQARRLAALNAQMAYVVVGEEERYFVLQQPLSAFTNGPAVHEDTPVDAAQPASVGRALEWAATLRATLGGYHAVA